MKFNEQITKRDIVNVIFRNKSKIIAMVLVAFIVTTIGSYLWPKEYRTESKLLIKLGRENTPLPSGIAGGTVVVSKREEDVNSEIEIITNTFLISEVTKRMEAELNGGDKESLTLLDKIKHSISSAVKSLKQGLESTLAFVGLIEKKSPFEKLLLKVQKKLEVEPRPLTDVISISFTWKDPDVAIKFVKTLISQFLEYHLKVHRNGKTLDFFVNQVALLKTKLAESRDALLRFEKNHSIIQFDTEKLQLLKQANRRKVSVQNLESELQEVGARVSSLQTSLQTVPRNIVLSEEKEYNPIVLANLEREMATLIMKEQELHSKYFDKSSKIAIVQSQIKLLKNQISDEQNRIYGSTRSGINKNWTDLNIQLVESKVRLISLKVRVGAEKRVLLTVQNRLAELREIESHYKELNQQVEIDKKNFLLYEEKMEQSRIEDAMEEGKLSNIRIIQPVMTPAKPVILNKILVILLSLIFSTLLGIALSFYFEYISTALTVPADIDDVGMPFLGTIMEIEKSQKSEGNNYE